jgi:hypothetical protein
MHVGIYKILRAEKERSVAKFKTRYLCLTNFNKKRAYVFFFFLLCFFFFFFFFFFFHQQSEITFLSRNFFGFKGAVVTIIHTTDEFFAHSEFHPHLRKRRYLVEVKAKMTMGAKSIVSYYALEVESTLLPEGKKIGQFRFFSLEYVILIGVILFFGLLCF